MIDSKRLYYAEFKSGNCVIIKASGITWAKDAAKDFADSFRTRVSAFHAATEDEVNDHRRQGGSIYETV